MALILESAEDTMTLGAMLAEAMKDSPVRSLYLFAGLGGGKTTLTRGFVRALPGSESAEVASPSFTLCNVYPTCPAVLHADLYRLHEGTSLMEEMDELMEDGDPLLLLEWPERLPETLYARERLDLHLIPCEDSNPEHLDNSKKSWKSRRLAVIDATGECARQLLRELMPRLENRFPSDKT